MPTTFILPVTLGNLARTAAGMGKYQFDRVLIFFLSLSNELCQFPYIFWQLLFQTVNPEVVFFSQVNREVTLV